MNHRIKQFLVAAASLGCALTASAAERNPALDLLVKKGIITAEERAQALEQAAIVNLRSGPKEAAWYEKLSIDGYTQVRHTEQMNDAAYLTGGLPADRSVDPNQSLIIRRGRFKLAGDFGRVYLYTQWDVAASVDSGTSRNFGLQTRDIYADIALDEAKEHRVRIGVSKVPYGFVNLQSSQNRLQMERPEALNSAVEGERDQGIYYMYANTEDRALFKSLVKDGLKGSGDYGVFTAGFYSGAGLNKADNNGEVHSVVRLSKPWVSASGQTYEAGIGAYAGRFKVTTDLTTGSGLPGGVSKTTLDANINAVDRRDLSDGFVDRRASAHFIMYPQPWGIEAEWTTGQGPQLTDDRTSVTSQSLQGGYIMVNYRHKYGEQSELIPYVRWNYFDGARKFATNAPKMVVNELDIGFEWQWRKEVELQLQYTLADERSNTSTAMPTVISGSRRLALQLQFNY
ncbi:MAG: porin [Opitutales bacterium]